MRLCARVYMTQLPIVFNYVCIGKCICVCDIVLFFFMAIAKKC